MDGTEKRRRWVTWVATASLVASGLGATGAAQAAPEAPSAEQKIDDEVDRQLQAEGRTDVWVRLSDRADLSAASSIEDWDARGQAVVDALRATAESSQKEVRAQLDQRGVEYEAFWATNSIRLGGADAELVSTLAASADVEGIYPTLQIEVPDLKEDEPQLAPAAVEWGVNDIKAPQVWNDFGAHGEGIVVASIDTGAQYDHPALVNQYRGNNGDGTFDHNYSWFDAAGRGSAFPVDTNGHGTHVTGTMVGSDGGDNQIGVAPGARWISANGCCPSDAALISSGQWMLEPRDLQGQNPDVSKRPHIINNSWGTTAPSTAPFMEDIIIAWAASGQFGVFANGNSGPACQSGGSPGSRIVAYSVGNYTSSHAIASSSARGAGQDGEIKPNISAPGSAVRSSVPGNGYASYTGTSMASPHVAGAVALVWSAAPAIVGDVNATRALLDGSATDSESLTCGGTADDNNVFGEGRLDALQLVNDAPTGNTGTLNGTVTDSASGDALTDVSVSVVGPISRDLVTDDQGTYNALLTIGDYALTFSRFGYVTEEATATITDGGTTTLDAALDPAPSRTVSGTVTDGSGYGFPLYARVAVDGTPVEAYTDPATGAYSLELPEGQTFRLSVQVQYPGYQVAHPEVSTTSDQTVDVSVPVDANTCTAPGYGYQVDGVTESFDGTVVPEGWEVLDHKGNGQVWRFDDPDGRGNLTGGEGNFAIMDSDYYGGGTAAQDTSLVSPSVDMTALSNPVVGFKQDWRGLGDDLADVDVSLDGGATWSTVLSQDLSVRGPNETVVPLPTAAGAADVKVRFHMWKAEFDWWWEVDDVFLGNRACVPQGAGGYVVGTVTGVDTGEGVVGATVTNLDTPSQTGTTIATPADEALADGFYWIFSDTPGAHPFEAAARLFETKVQDVTVVDGSAVRADFSLGSGFVVLDPTSLETSLTLGGSRTGTLTVTNTGSGAAEVEVAEVAGGFTMLGADGTTTRTAASGEAGEVITLEVPTSFAAGAGEVAAQGSLDPEFAPTAEWQAMTNYPTTVMDGRTVSVDGDWYTVGGTSGSAAYATVHRYDTAAQAWAPVAPLPSARSAVTAGAVDGQIVVSGGWVTGGTTAQTLVYDPAADAWTAMAANPASVSAAGSAVVDGLLYSVGGCTTSSCTPMSSAVTAYDLATDTWAELADYPVAAAFISCGGVDGQVVCTGGNPGSGGIADSYAYDPAADAWSALPDAPVDTWASQHAAANGMLVVNGGVQAGAVSNATFAYDPTSDAWVDLPASGAAVYRGGAACGLAKVGGSSGSFNAVSTAEHLPGYDDCGSSGADVAWLSVDQTSFTLEPGATVELTVTTDGAVAQPGTYTAGLKVRANTPQRLETVPVTMTVAPPRTWAKLMGTVTGQACDGSRAALPGATVDVTAVSGGASWTLITDEDGGYARWMNATKSGDHELIVAKDGYRPTSGLVKLKKGTVTTSDHTLVKAGC